MYECKQLTITRMSLAIHVPFSQKKLTAIRHKVNFAEKQTISMHVLI